MTNLEDLHSYVLKLLPEFEELRGRRASHNRRAFTSPEATRIELIRQVGKPTVEAVTDIILAGKADTLTAEAVVIRFRHLFPSDVVGRAERQLRRYLA